MNIIQFKVKVIEKFDRIYIEIDGKPLVDIMREIELPMAEKEGYPNLAGDYEGVNLPEKPFDYFLGADYADRGREPNDNKTGLLASKGCGGLCCLTVVCKIDVNEDTVRWSNFEHEDEENWDYSGFEGFVFSKTQYLDALNSITAKPQTKKFH